MPGNSGSIRAGRAFVEIFADNTMLVRGLNQAAARLKAFGAGVKAIGTKMFALGAGIVTPMIAAAKMFAVAGDEMAEMSARTGIAVEQLSTLGYAAKQSGSDMESLEIGIKKMQKFIVQAASGGESANQALRELGLSARDFAGIAPDQQMKLLADRIAAIKDPTLKAATALEIFGRGGTSLLPLLSTGSRGIEAFQARARALGLQMSTESAEAGHEFSKSLQTLFAVVKKSSGAIGSALAPMLQGLAIAITNTLVQINQWIKANGQLVRYLFQIGALVAAAGIGLIIFGTVLSKVGLAISGLASVGKMIAPVFTMAMNILAGLLSPLGLLIGAVAGFGAYLIYSAGAGGKALTWLGQRFGNLARDATTSFNAISDALASGNISAAAKVLWAMLKMEWQKGCASINEVWQGMWAGIQTLAVDVWAGLQVGWQSFVKGLTDAWITAASFLQDVWTRFTNWLANKNREGEGWVTKMALEVQSWTDDDVKNRLPELEAMADEQTNKDTSANDAATAQKRAANKKYWDDYQAQSDAQHQKDLEQIGTKLAAQQQAIADAKGASLAASQENVKTATQEWQQAVKAAQTLPGATGGLNDLDTQLQKYKGQIGDLEGLMDSTRKTSVAGTFNSSAAWGMAAGGNAAERTAKNTERTAVAAEKTNNYLRNQTVPTFGP